MTTRPQPRRTATSVTAREPSTRTRLRARARGQRDGAKRTAWCPGDHAQQNRSLRFSAGAAGRGQRAPQAASPPLDPVRLTQGVGAAFSIRLWLRMQPHTTRSPVRFARCRAGSQPRPRSSYCCSNRLRRWFRSGRQSAFIGAQWPGLSVSRSATAGTGQIAGLMAARTSRLRAGGSQSRSLESSHKPIDTRLVARSPSRNSEAAGGRSGSSARLSPWAV